MVSYAWGEKLGEGEWRTQALVKRIVAGLKARGFRVWPVRPPPARRNSAAGTGAGGGGRVGLGAGFRPGMTSQCSVHRAALVALDFCFRTTHAQLVRPVPLSLF